MGNISQSLRLLTECDMSWETDEGETIVKVDNIMERLNDLLTCVQSLATDLDEQTLFVDQASRDRAQAERSAKIALEAVRCSVISKEDAFPYVAKALILSEKKSV